MLIITGATGTLGSQIVQDVLARVPAATVGVSVRDPEKASALAEAGVRVRACDFTDPASLEHAFEGADRVLVISAAIRGDHAIAANMAALDGARAAGARRVLYTSHQAASPDSLFAPQTTHAGTEAHLAQGGAFTALRHGFYANILGFYIRGALESGLLALPADGPVSWTAHADLAEADAIALTVGGQNGVFDGVTAPLTASESLDLAAIAEILTDLSGKPVTRVVLDDDEWAATSVANGMPAGAAEFTLGMFRASRRGEFDVVDPTLATLLGRPTTTARSVLQDILAAG